MRVRLLKPFRAILSTEKEIRPATLSPGAICLNISVVSPKIDGLKIEL